jgi:hypothetical protein
MEELFNSEKEDKLIVLFNKTLTQFLKEINKSFPECNFNKLKEYKEIEDDNDTFILYYMHHIEKDIEKIANEDETLFAQIDTCFLRDIDFKHLWNEKTSENNKKAIWKFLQTLYIIGKPFINNKADIHSLIGKFNKILNNTKNTDNDTLQSIDKQMKIIYKIIDNLNKEKDEQKQKRQEEFNEDENIPDFLKGSKIGQLAQELTSELDLEELGLGGLNEDSDPKNVFENILGKNPTKLLTLIQTVGTKIQTKMSDGGIDEDVLKNEIGGMMSSLGGENIIADMFKDDKMKDMLKNMSGMFGGNPEMAEMFNNINPDDLQNFASQFSQDMANGSGNNSKMRVDNNKLQTMKTKANLKKKLQAKQVDKEATQNNTMSTQASEQITEEDINTIFDKSFDEVLQQEKKEQSMEQQKKKKSNKKKKK